MQRLAIVLSASKQSLLSGVLASFFGFFLPIKNILLFLILLFSTDVFFGWLNNRKKTGKKFEPKVVWKTTLPRLAISAVLIICSFLWDKFFDQNIVSSYKVIGWFISGILIYSIAENGYQLTGWRPFRKVSEIFKNKIERETNYKVNENETKD